MENPQLGEWTKCSDQLPEDTWDTREIGDGVYGPLRISPNSIEYTGNEVEVVKEICLVSVHDITEPHPVIGEVRLLVRKRLNNNYFCWVRLGGGTWYGGEINHVFSWMPVPKADTVENKENAENGND